MLPLAAFLRYWVFSQSHRNLSGLLGLSGLPSPRGGIGKVQLPSPGYFDLDKIRQTWGLGLSRSKVGGIKKGMVLVLTQ